MATHFEESPPSPVTRAGSWPVSPWIIGLLTVVMSVALLRFVCFSGANVPYLDDWDIVPALTGNQAITFDWLWSQHNEHRLPLARLLLLGLYHVSAFDFRAGMVFNAAGLILMTVLMLHAALRIRGRISLTDAFMPLLFLSWAHYDNLLWSWQVGFVLATLFVILALHALSQSATPKRLTGLYLGILVCALSLAGAVGLAFAAPLSMWMMMVAWVYRRQDASLATTFAVGGLSGLLLIGLYFIGYQSAAIQPPNSVREWFAGTVDFLSMGLAPLGLPGLDRIARISIRELVVYASEVVGYAIAAMLLAGLLANLVIRPSRPESIRAAGFGAIMAGAFILALGVAWGRGGQCLMPRYVTLGAPGLAAIYLSTLVRPGSRIGLCLRISLLVWSILILLPNMNSARASVLHRQEIKILPFERDLQKGVPAMVLADHYSQPPQAIYPRPRQDDLAADIRMLKRRGIGLFRGVNDDPAYRTLDISPDRASSNGAGWYSLKEEQHVYAVRVTYQYLAHSPSQFWAIFRLAWLPPGATESQTREYARPLPLTGESDRLLVWINEPLARFHISPDDGSAQCRINSVQLLVKP